MKNFSVVAALTVGLFCFSGASQEARAQSTVKIAKKVEKSIEKDYCKKDRKCKTAAFKLIDKHCGRKWWEGCFFDLKGKHGAFKGPKDRKWIDVKDYLDKNMK